MSECTVPSYSFVHPSITGHSDGSSDHARMVSVHPRVVSNRRSDRLLFFHVDIGQMGKTPRALRAARGPVVRKLHVRRVGLHTSHRFLPENLQTACRPQVRRPVPDADSLFDDTRPGAGEQRVHQGLLAFH